LYSTGSESADLHTHTHTHTHTLSLFHPTPHCQVYESCSTKRFLRGRTEAIRSNTLASSAFVRAADDLLARGALGMREARALLESATIKHRDMASAASQAKGVDRHLFSLLSLANEVSKAIVVSAGGLKRS
jgi:hypothetical protein